MFEGSEHEGYRTLCLTLNLERKPEDWRDGDVYAAAWADRDLCGLSTEMHPTEITLDTLHVFAPSCDEYSPVDRTLWVWLPRLDQWLAILRNYCTGFCLWQRPDGWDANPTALDFELCKEPLAASSPEEALAQLCMEIMDKRDTP